MKKLLFGFLLITRGVIAQETVSIYAIPDVRPSFQGGSDSLVSFLERTIVYPQEAAQKRIEGELMLYFIVSSTGAISKVNIHDSIADCEECSKEAMRVVRLMPLWIPASINGRAIENTGFLWIKFNLPFGPVNNPARTEIMVEDLYTRNDHDIVYDKVDSAAHFPGGEKRLNKFLSKNIKRPEVVSSLLYSTTCYINFVVLRNGSITDVKVKRGVTDCPECDQEALRLVKLMPQWEPGLIEGKPVNSYFNLPVRFWPLE